MNRQNRSQELIAKEWRETILLLDESRDESEFKAFHESFCHFALFYQSFLFRRMFCRHLNLFDLRFAKAKPRGFH